MNSYLDHFSENYNDSKYWPNNFKGGTPYPTATPTNPPSHAPTHVSSAFPSTSSTSSFCPVSTFVGSTIHFAAFGACWKAELFDNGVLAGDFTDPKCLREDFISQKHFSRFDSYNSNSLYFNDPNQFNGYFTVQQSSDVTDIEVHTNELDQSAKFFSLNLLAPNCIAPGSCLAGGFLGETLYVAAFNACYKIEVFAGGILARDSSDLDCSKNDSSKEQIVSRFVGIDGGQLRFNDPNRWDGIFILKESSSVAIPQVQPIEVDNNARNFVIALIVPSCKN